jgi:hypothetical protein
MLWLHIPDPLTLVLAVLATFRLTSIMHSEKIAQPFRDMLGISMLGPDDHTGEFVLTYPDNFVGHLFECFWCLSVWVGGLISIYISVFPAYPFSLVLLPFALSAGAILFRKLVD